MDTQAQTPNADHLSAIVSRLAKDAHRLLRSETLDPELVARVRARMGKVEKRIARLPDAPIHRWLENLRRQVEAREALVASAG